MDEELKYLYEKSIEGYKFNIERHKDWMNLYAIFVGAFFVGYYNIDDVFIKNIIVILGLITSICWLGSFLGYYNWQISWIKILQYHEELYLKKLGKEHFNHRVYTMISNDKNILYSTQKITKIFIYFVIIGWITISIYQIVKCLENRIDFFVIIFSLLVCCAVLIPLYIRKILKVFFLSDTKNMYELKFDKTNKKYTTIDPEEKLEINENESL